MIFSVIFFLSIILPNEPNCPAKHD